MIHQDLSVVTMAGSPFHRVIYSTEFITIYLKSVYKSYCYKLTGSFKGWILNISPLKVFKICNSPKNFMKGTKGWKTHSIRRFFQGTPKVF